MLDVLSSLFIWVSDSQLDYATIQTTEEREQEGGNRYSEAVYGKCVKVEIVSAIS